MGNANIFKKIAPIIMGALLIFSMMPSTLWATDYMLALNAAPVVEEGGTAQFWIALNTPITGGDVVTVQYHTNNGSAFAPGDYTAVLSGTTTITIQGDTTTGAYATVITNNDSGFENTENFSVTIYNPTNTGGTIGITLGSATKTCNITDNDYNISIGDAASVEEGQTASFPITLSPALRTGHTVTVQYTTTPGSADATDDYTAESGTTVTISASGTTQAFATVTTIDDIDFESTENFSVNIHNATNTGGDISIIEAGPKTCNITDNDYEISIGDAADVQEGQTASFPITLNPALRIGDTVTVEFTTTNGTARSDYGDFVAHSGTTITFNTPGQTNAVANVTTNNDDYREITEGFTVSIDNAVSTNGFVIITGGGGQDCNITDDGDMYDVSITNVTTPVTEASGATVAVTVELSKVDPFSGVSGNPSVDYHTFDDGVPGWAIAGDDYQSKSGTLTFSSGTTSIDVPITILQDTYVEGSEKFSFEIHSTSPDCQIFGANIWDATIQDDGDTYDVSITNVASSSVTEAATNVTFTVELANVDPTNGVASEAHVNYATSDSGSNPATADSDYTNTNGTLTFNSGTSGIETVNVPILEDSLVENDETFAFTLSGFDGGGAITGTNPEIVTIQDDGDTYEVSITTIAPDPVTEADGAEVIFTVGLSHVDVNGVVGSPSVQYRTLENTAKEGSDYTAATNTLTFSSGTTSIDVGITILNDTDVENDEEFYLELHTASGCSIAGTNPGEATIADDGIDTYGVAITAIAPDPVTEADGAEVTFTVELSHVDVNGVVGSPSVDYQTLDVTAKAGIDYTADSNTLTFSSGTSSINVPITILNDTDVEDDETFQFNLYNESGCSVTGTNPESATIADDGIDTYEVSIISHTTDPALEGTDPTVTFTVGLSHVDVNGVVGSPSVDYQTLDMTAKAGSDYTADSNTLTFSSGTSSIDVPITILNDTDVENDETFQFELYGESGCSITGTNPGEATIADDGIDTYEVSITTIAPDPVTEADGAEVTFTVELSHVDVNGVVGSPGVQYQTLDFTARAGIDYTAASNTLTFSSGTSSINVPITILNDTDVENDEEFYLELHTASGCSITGLNPVEATIADDGIDTYGVSITTIAPDPVTEADGAEVTFTVGLSHVDVNGVVGSPSVQYQTLDGTARAGSDYTAATNTLTFSSGTSSIPVPITILNDTDVEDDETFQFELFGESGCTIAGTNPGEATIADDGIDIYEVSTTNIAPDPVTEADGAEVTFTVELTHVDVNGVVGSPSVQYQTLDASAKAGSDYTAASDTLTFSSGTSSINVPITILNDTDVEDDETFQFELFGESGCSIAGANPEEATIADDGIDIYDVSITTIAPNPVTETDLATVTFTVGLTHVDVNGVVGSPSVQYQTLDVTARAGSDYTAASDTLTFSGTTSIDVDITILNDTDVEDDETFEFELFGESGCSIAGTNPGEATITDDGVDGYEVSIKTIAPDPAIEGTDPTVTFTVELSNVDVNGVVGSPSVQYQTLENTAKAGIDYTADSNTLTFSSGTSSINVPITILNDTDVESAETFYLELHTASGCTIAGTNPGEAEIQDDGIDIYDVSITNITPNPVTEADGAEVTFTVELSHVDVNGVVGSPSVQYQTLDNTAKAGSDYTAATNTLTFSSGTTSIDVPITILNDTDVENDETFQFNLYNESGCSVTGTNPESATIQDDGIDTYEVSITTIAPDPAIEGIDSTVTFTVELLHADVNGVVGSPSVQYQTLDVSAKAGTDYSGTSDTLTFNGTTTSFNEPITILNDADVENDETFYLELHTASGCSIAGTNPGVATIADDGTDVYEVSITNVATSPVTEENTNVTFTIELINVDPANGVAPVGGVHVNYETSDSGGNPATAGSDYSATSGVITFNSGTSGVETVNVPILEDSLVENDETFNFELNPSSFDGGGSITGTNPETVTIQDDVDVYDVSITTLTPNPVTEDNTDVDVTVALANVDPTNGVVGTVTVAFDTVDSGAYPATADNDYASVSEILEFSGTTGVLTRSISIYEDDFVEYDETFSVSLSSFSGGGAITGTNPQIVTITNDDTYNVTISGVTPSTVTEDATIVAVTVVSLNVDPDYGLIGGTFHMDYDTSDSGTTPATANSDYTDTDGQLSFSPTSGATIVVNVPILEDSLVEDDETFDFILSNLDSGGSIINGSETITIQDDGDTYDISITNVATTPVTEADTNVTFTVGLSNVEPTYGVLGGVTVEYATIDGPINPATAGSDYSAVSGVLTFSGTTDTLNVDVTILQDTEVEPDERFDFDLGNFGGGGSITGTNPEAVIIEDDDDKYIISVDDDNATEGDAVQFTVSLSQAVLAGDSVTVYYQTNDDTTTIADNDYTPHALTQITINPGEFGKTIDIATTADANVEPDETFFVDLSTPSANASILDIQGIGTIVNNDYLLTLTMEGDGTVTSNPTGIDCPGDCEEGYNYGTDVELTANPSADWSFVRWEDSGVTTLSTSSPYTVTVNSGTTIHAVFGHTLTVYTPHGGVASSPAGIDCESGNTCSAVFSEDDFEFGALLSTPDAGWRFDNWSEDCPSGEENNNPMQFSTGEFDSHKYIVANYIKTWDVEFTVSGDGSLSGNTTQTVDDGTNTTPVTAIPDDGYYFVGWSGSYNGLENPLTITNVTSDMGIVANFAANEHCVFKDQGDVSLEGDWQPLGTFEFSAGAEPTVTLHCDGDGVVVADAVRFVGPSSDTIDNDDSGCTRAGSWNWSNSGPEYGDDYWYSNDKGAYYKWKASPLSAGTYTVEAHWVERTGSDRTARYCVDTYNKHIITAIAGPNGSIAPAGDAEGKNIISTGADQTFTITPAADYVIEYVKVDNDYLFSYDGSGATSYTFYNVTSDHTISVAFDHGEASTTCSEEDQRSDGGQWNSLGTFEFGAGTNAYVTVTRSGNGSSTCADAVRFRNTSTGAEVIVDNSGDFSGWGGTFVPSDPSIFDVTSTWRGSNGSNYYGPNPPRSIYTSTTGGSATWTPNLPTAGEYEVYAWWTTSGNRDRRAEYCVHNHVGKIVTATSGLHGEMVSDGVTVDPGTSEAFQVVTGENRTFTITADADYAVQDVIVDGVSVGAVASYTFTNIQASHRIRAIFEDHADDCDDATPVSCGGTESGNISPAGNKDYFQIDVAGSILLTIYTTGFTDTYGTLMDETCNTIDTLAEDDDSGINQNFRIDQEMDAGTYYVEVSGAQETETGTYTLYVECRHLIRASAQSGGSISPDGDNIVDQGDNISFTITPDAGNTVEDVLVDGFSVGGVTTYQFLNVTSNHTIVAQFSLPPESCVDISDNTLEAMSLGTPAIVMVVLDDSGSMDWEFMTEEGDGLFESEYYIFNPGDNEYSSDRVLSGTDKGKWKSQWSAYNKMYYNPNTPYEPWPTLDNADLNRPQSHPYNGTDYIDLDTVYYTVRDAVVVDNEGYFTWNQFHDNGAGSSFEITGNWYRSFGSNPYGINYSIYTQQVGATATWTPNLPTSGWYNVYAYWTDADDMAAHAPYTIHHKGGDTTVDVNQDWNEMQFNLLGNFEFDAGTGGYVRLLRENDDDSTCADAVMFEPGTNIINIYNSHYYTWEDLDGDGERDTGETVYLVNLVSGTSTIEYYSVDTTDDVVGPGDLTWVDVASVPDTVRPRNAGGTFKTYEEERQNFANWVSFYRRRELTATAAISTVIASMENIYLGIRSINGNIVQPAVPIKSGVSDETGNLLITLYSMDLQAQGTPLRQGFERVGQYISKSDGVLNGGIGDSPYLSAADGGMCQQAFAIVMTDGYYNGSDPSGVTNADGNNDTDFDGPPYGDTEWRTLADVAMHYYERDLAPALDNELPANPGDSAEHQHLVTYSVSFGVTGTLNPEEYDENLIHEVSGVTVAWPDPDDGDHEKIDDLWHAAVNGRGAFLSAQNPQELIASLVEIMADISSRTGSASSVSINGDELYSAVGEDVRMFQASYSSGSKTGDVQSYQIDIYTGGVSDAPVWSASEILDDELDTYGHTNRIIATYNPETEQGIPFTYGYVSTSGTTQQMNDLQPDWGNPAVATIENLINYLRGDETYEVVNGGPFRSRATRLGDVVHSTPVHSNGVVYAGANDGMLHAFDATGDPNDPNDHGGNELFAYVPSLVFENLKELGNPDYTHKFFVDLTPYVKDIGSQTILIGGLAKGGKGYYALDVTDISGTSAFATASDLAAHVLWEYPRASTPSDERNDLGYSFSEAYIVRSNDTANAEWVAIFGNGYNSENSHAVLFILDPLTGNIIRRLDTGIGSCNGLSTPLLIDTNSDAKVDYVYAGDIKGNLWKFDLTDPDYNNWGVAYGVDNDADGHIIYDSGVSTPDEPKPLFQARGPGGTNQPISTQPSAMYHCEKHGIMVVFGTGMYLGESDLSDNSQQTIYGIWDYGDDEDDSEYLGSFNSGVTPQLSNQPEEVSLMEQTAIFENYVHVDKDNDSIVDPGEMIYFRVLSRNEPIWQTTALDEGVCSSTGTGDDCDPNGIGTNPDPVVNAGWYFDLPISGERLASDLMIRLGKVILIAFNPEDSPCGAGGDSMLMEFDACSGCGMVEAQFDINDDGVIDDNDLIYIEDPDNPGNYIWIAPSGMRFPGRLQPPAILRIPELGIEIKYMATTEGGKPIEVKEPTARVGLIYWQEYN